MKVQGLKKNYGKSTVVDNVSFEIHKGMVTSFIGPNGAGKSTVMGMISRLVAKDQGLISFPVSYTHLTLPTKLEV